MKNNVIEFDKNLVKERLENGLTYYLYNNSSSRGEVRLALVVKVGSLMEKDDEVGISHFIEHFCIYKGKKCFDGCNRDISMLCGYTKLMETVYWKKSKTVDLINDLLSLKNILVGKNFSEFGIEKIRCELADEIDRVTNKTAFKLKKIILPEILKINDLGNKLPIGKIENINRFNYEFIIDFYKKYYEPQNSAVLVVGDIGNYNLKKFMQDSFLKIQNSEEKLSEVAFNKTGDLKQNKILVNVFNDLKEDEIQFYYPKSALKYESKLDLEKKIEEYFRLNYIQQCICNQFINKNMDYSTIDFVSQRLTKEFNYNVLQVKTDGDLSEKLEFIIQILKRIALDGANEEVFNLYKREFFEEMKIQYCESKILNNKSILQECIDNYLYNEPIISLKQEYDICNLIVENIKLKQFNVEIGNMIKSKNVVVAINCRKDPHIDGSRINKLLEFI